MNDRLPMSGNIPAEIAERKSDPKVYWYEEVLIDPPVAASDDLISRADLLAAIFRMIEERGAMRRADDPFGPFWKEDGAAIAAYAKVMNYVTQMEEGKPL